MNENDLKISDEQLLDNLGLIDNGRLKRAGVLLFHRNPEKWITGAYIKIGYFETDSDLRYQDEIHGSLFLQAERVIDVIYLKYLKADISYSNVTRIETYPFPKSALREAIYNAIIHSDYSAQIPIQISVYKDKMYISNSCVFPIGWTVETLMKKHRSQPYNPNIANGFFRAGFVETWGRGIEKICEECSKYGIPQPQYTLHPEDIMIEFLSRQKSKVSKVHNDTLDEPLENQILVLIKENSKITQLDIAKTLNVSVTTIKRVIKKLNDENILTREGGKRYGHWKIN